MFAVNIGWGFGNFGMNAKRGGGGGGGGGKYKNVKNGPELERFQTFLLSSRLRSSWLIVSLTFVFVLVRP